MNEVRLGSRRIWLGWARASLMAHLLAWPATLVGDPLVVGPGMRVRLGDPDRPMSQGYDALTIEAGGAMELDGDMTVSVLGDIVLDGSLTWRTSDKAPSGGPGTDGMRGADDQPTGANVGSAGRAGQNGTPWILGGAPRLELRSQGTIIIRGTIDLRPEFDGGDGGRGGRGGDGGSGRSGNPGEVGAGGFAGQAGAGGAGGHAGLPGPTLRITAQRIELQAGGRILMDNLGQGGRGGDGGDGGDGGRGGDGVDGHGERGGGGGTAGGGGRGGMGGNGGILHLTADTIVVDGEISLKGGDGGPGGAAGSSGSGGDGGAGDGSGSFRGGAGGNAGDVGGSGPRGGMGGGGGNGGILLVRAHQHLAYGRPAVVDGGSGGPGGAGRGAAVGKGGQGGAGDPAGPNGSDSGALSAGETGAEGSAGTVQIWPAFALPRHWVVTGSIDCIGPVWDDDETVVAQRGLVMCGGVCLSTFHSIDRELPIELSFEHRWLTASGVLEFRLGDRVLHRLTATGTVDEMREAVRVVSDDPAFRESVSQRFEICVSPAEARIELVGVQLRGLPAEGPPSPMLRVTVDPAGGGVGLVWDSVAGWDYRLQMRTSLGVGTGWTEVGEIMPGTGGELAAPAGWSTALFEGYYRVLVTAP